MAKNGPRGHGRIGVIKQRRQVYNPKNRRWTEQDTKTGKFTNQKANKEPFKDVRRVK